MASEKVKQRLLQEPKTQRDVAWERRKKMIVIQEKKLGNLNEETKLTDEDLDELKGSIELGFGFNEKAAGQKLCNTLPALDLYFAVNRQLSPLRASPSTSRSNIACSSVFSNSISVSSNKTDSDALKILCPGGNPQQVKQRLRHWAQAVACSVMQSS